jgi:hypothetical protein
MLQAAARIPLVCSFLRPNCVNLIPRSMSTLTAQKFTTSTTSALADQKNAIIPQYVSWEQGRANILELVPPLVSDLHKGSCGRIAVFGGSAEYTGAPYYGATAALKFVQMSPLGRIEKKSSRRSVCNQFIRVGADLAFVLTAAEAALPIKCYGPELMVLPMYSIAEFDKASSESEKKALVDAAVAKASH